MPLLVIVSGILGGVILTVAIIMIVILCRRNLPCLKCLIPSKKDTEKEDNNRNLPSSKLMTTVKTMSSGDSTGSEEKTTSCTTSDGVSNNSSELKVEVRTSSSLSEDHWDRGSDDSFAVTASKVNGGPPTFMKPSDYVDGLQRQFEVSIKQNILAVQQPLEK